MNKIKNYITEIKNYCDFNLEFDSLNELYRFNTKSAENIDTKDFYNKIENFKLELISILKASENSTLLIEEVLTELYKITKWYEKEGIYKFSNFNKLDKLIVETVNHPIILTEQKKYTLKEILEIEVDMETKYEELLYYIISKKSFTFDYLNPLDLERVKLHFVLIKFFESISSLEKFLLQLMENFNKYGYYQFNDIMPTEYWNRCTIKLNKIESAHFFNALFESELFYFPNYPNGSNNMLKKRNQFIEDNFNYTDNRNKNKVVKIESIEKEFSTIGGVKKKYKNIEFIDSIILKLEKIKGKM
ncbi:MAG: hypothetical protein RLZZ323_643 [Bacteroidota bacterium]|jgi:hypothetical protein